MTRMLRLLILGVLIPLVMVQYGINCPVGFIKGRAFCVDIDECYESLFICGLKAMCYNTIGSYYCQCEPGFRSPQHNFTALTGSCSDIDECNERPFICGLNAMCYNTNGSYYCQCEPGFRSPQHNFTALTGSCSDIDECNERPFICGLNAMCYNTNGSYYCQCEPGFRSPQHNFTALTGSCSDINECLENSFICGEGEMCINQIAGFECLCRTGFAIYGNKCVELGTGDSIGQITTDFEKYLSLLRNHSLAIGTVRPLGTGNQSTGEELIQAVMNVMDDIQLSSSNLSVSSREVSMLLISVEKTVSLIARHLRQNVTRITLNHTELEVVVSRGRHPPRGAVRLNNENVGLDTTWETAIGDDAHYLGFGYVFLFSYKNLTTLFKTSDRPISAVATVSVSNPNRTALPQPVNITFTRLQPSDADPICAYWSETEQGSGAWSGRGCTTLMSNSTHTVCSCNHLSSFALIQGIRKRKLSVVISVGASVAVVSVVLSLLATLWCRHVSKRKPGRLRQQPI